MSGSKPCSALIVGGGILGAACAFWLSRIGVGVRLYEAGAAGAEGASRHSGGMLRSFDFDPQLLQLSAAGTALMQDWTRLGLAGPGPLVPRPLWWLLDEERAAAARALLAGRPELADRLRLAPTAHWALEQPALRSASAPWALFDASGAVCDVRLAVRLLLQAAMQQGAEVFEHCPVDLSLLSGGRCRLSAGSQTLAADWVLLAGGWTMAASTAANTGAKTASALPAAWQLPGLRTRSVPQVLVQGLPHLPHAPRRPGEAGCLIEHGSGCYLRPLAPGRAAIGWSGEAFAGTQAPAPDPETARARLAALGEAMGWPHLPAIVGHVAGADAYSEDGRPLLRWHEQAGLCVAGGLSGRGFKYALLLGAAMAEGLRQRAGLPGLAPLPATAVALARQLQTAAANEELHDVCA